MKKFLPGFAFLLLCLTASSQEKQTAYDGLKIVTTASGPAAQLSWKKGGENVAYFIVERSANGADFKQCAIVFTSEDPAFTDYKFRDKISNAPQGLVYRLALVSDQKSVSYLPSKALNTSEAM